MTFTMLLSPVEQSCIESSINRQHQWELSVIASIAWLVLGKERYPGGISSAFLPVP